jgi:hypothetical protein
MSGGAVWAGKGLLYEAVSFFLLPVWLVNLFCRYIVKILEIQTQKRLPQAGEISGLSICLVGQLFFVMFAKFWRFDLRTACRRLATLGRAN